MIKILKKPHRESGGGGSKKDAKREAAQVFKIFIFAQVFKMLQILSFQDFKMIQTLKYFHFQGLLRGPQCL